MVKMILHRLIPVVAAGLLLSMLYTTSAVAATPTRTAVSTINRSAQKEALARPGFKMGSAIPDDGLNWVRYLGYGDDDILFAHYSNLEWFAGLRHVYGILYHNTYSWCCLTTKYGFPNSDIQHFGYLDFTSDGCSGPTIDKSGVYDFRRACVRHDFQYRNYKLLENYRRFFNIGDEGYKNIWNEWRRKFVDDKFLDDMHDDCNTRPVYFGIRYVCYVQAQWWYDLVRWLGS